MLLEALNAAEALRKAGYTDTRFSTAHSQMVDPKDLPRYKELDVVAQSTGNWAVAIQASIDALTEAGINKISPPLTLPLPWPAVMTMFANEAVRQENTKAAMI